MSSQLSVNQLIVDQYSVANLRNMPLRECVKSVLEAYFSDLNGHSPEGLYQMVLEEIEHPLLEVVMERTRGNQSKAAELLGINRGTLRKKLKHHGFA